MSIRLEVGKTYKNRQKDIIAIVSTHDNPNYKFQDTSGDVYTAQGGFFSTGRCELDLIEEVVTSDEKEVGIPLQLKFGETYLDRVGREVKIIKKDDHPEYPFDGDNEFSYCLNGKILSYGGETGHDIVSEAPQFKVKAADYAGVDLAEGRVAPQIDTQSKTLDEILTIRGDRQGQYGAPDDNFKDIAELWTLHLQQDWKRNPEKAMIITKQHVCTMMMLLKMARNYNGDKLDSWVDMANYAILGGDMVEKG